MRGAGATEARPTGTFPDGTSLLELLVALTCTALLAAVLLPTFVKRADTARRQGDELRITTAAEAAATAVAADLRRAGRWLEGASGIRRGGRVVPVVSSVADGPAHRLRILRSLGAPREVEESPGGGTYWVADVGDLEVDTVVVALAQPRRPATEPPPAGVVEAVWDGVEGGLVRVRWEVEESELLELWGVPARLVPVRVREYAIGESGGVRVLRRRDEGGRWQPLTESIGDLRVELWADRDGDGGPDSPVDGTGEVSGGVSVSHVVVEVEMVTTDGRRIRVRRWARLPRS